MKQGMLAGRWVLTVLVCVLAQASACARQVADDLASQLGLADMPAYHAALSGKATADDASPAAAPRAVSFRDLWDHADAWRGRRVIVQARIARVFRQDAVGSFPPLVEAWLSTRAGDLFCVVFPQDKTDAPQYSPEVGNQIAFTGTFLKSIRYAAKDQARLAPLIVGDRPPATLAHQTDASAAGPTPEPDAGPGQAAGSTTSSWTAATWTAGLLLGLAAAGVLAWQHVHGPARVRRPTVPRQGSMSTAADPPLEFMDTEDASGPADADADA